MKKRTFMQHVGFSGMLLRQVVVSEALACVLPDVGNIKKLTAYQQRKWPQNTGNGRSKEGEELSSWQEDRRAMGSGSMSNKKRICFCIVQLNCSWSHCLQKHCKQCWGITCIPAVEWYSSSSVSGYIFQDRNRELGHALSRLERDEDWSRLIESQIGLGWKGPQGSWISNPPARQGHQPPHLVGQVAQGPIQPGLEHLQGWGIYSLSGIECFSEHR